MPCPEFAHDPGNGFSCRPDTFRNLFMRQRNADAYSFFGFFAFVRPIKEKAGEFFTRGHGESDGARLLASSKVLRRQLAQHRLIDFRVLFNEAREIFVPYERNLTWLQSFYRRLVGAA